MKSFTRRKELRVLDQGILENIYSWHNGNFFALESEIIVQHGYAFIHRSETKQTINIILYHMILNLGVRRAFTFPRS